ncbi:hypothetical protein FDV58_03075 [Bradyrhizobium elkanii]|uniref:Uncharacterized protein n=1 Tax=Bradyrhizobium elkanii TaxID=29448 RepID=A0A4U6S670_BRAEL|nr:hypothetical protein [Bradyrhizobium sp. BR2003]TKV83239.1 hypothetical protein FDV58_03075 [Bradyrhizobium elkanii]
MPTIVTGSGAVSSRNDRDLRPGRSKAFSSEVGTGSREENASKQESRAPFRFDRNGALNHDAFARNRIMISSPCLSMIFSENRFPLFRIML